MLSGRECVWASSGRCTSTSSGEFEEFDVVNALVLDAELAYSFGHP